MSKAVDFIDSEISKLDTDVLRMQEEISIQEKNIEAFNNIITEVRNKINVLKLEKEKTLISDEELKKVKEDRPKGGRG